MGCVSSNLLNHDDEFTQLGSSALSHHIVSLTSSTYGLLNLDPPPRNCTTPTTAPTPPPRFTLGSTIHTPQPKSLWSDPRPIRSDPEVINSWELMAGLDADSFRFSPLPAPKPLFDKENSNPNRANRANGSGILRARPVSGKNPLDRFERLCPPNGENRVVVYTTTLRGVRRTFESCNAVRAAIEAAGVILCERDVSMDRGFREELTELMKGKEREALIPPRVFVNGRYIGGAEEILKIAEEQGGLCELFDGMPKRRGGFTCEGCGNVRFLPCFQCNGSCKLVKEGDQNQGQGSSTVVVRCPDCNENGLVLCPICS
ncbi:hypothetical protein UlMin_001689 [Ulmus minor]